MNLDSRVQTLEKQIKNLKKMLGGVAALALAALIGGTVMGVHAARNKTFDTLTAKTLYLKNSNNKRTVQIYGSNGVLYLYNSSGKKRVALQSFDGTVKTLKSNGITIKAELGKGSGASGPHTHPVAKHKHTVKVTVN